MMGWYLMYIQLGWVEAIKAEWRQPTFVQSVVAETVATAIFLFFLILRYDEAPGKQSKYILTIMMMMMMRKKGVSWIPPHGIDLH